MLLFNKTEVGNNYLNKEKTMGDIVKFKRKTNSEKYYEKVAETHGVETSEEQLSGIALYNQTLEEVIRVLRNNNTKLQYENILAVLGTLMAEICVAAEIDEANVSIDSLLMYISKRYDKSLGSWLDSGCSLNDYLDE
jgi:hypothetical protein